MILYITMASKPSVRQIQTTDGKRYLIGRTLKGVFQASIPSKTFKMKSSALKAAKAKFN